MEYKNRLLGAGVTEYHQSEVIIGVEAASLGMTWTPRGDQGAPVQSKPRYIEPDNLRAAAGGFGICKDYDSGSVTDGPKKDSS